MSITSPTARRAWFAPPIDRQPLETSGTSTTSGPVETTTSTTVPSGTSSPASGSERMTRSEVDLGARFGDLGADLQPRLGELRLRFASA